MPEYHSKSAAARSLANCHTCGLVSNISVRKCPRCGAKLHLRDPNSLQITLALLATALILYVPANALPIMSTERFGNEYPNTILQGVVTLWHHGSYVIAAIIFLASVLIPIAKLSIMLYLCWTVWRKRSSRQKERATLYHITEIVGRWSMVDVFVVAILVAMVQLGDILSITPGPAALAFGGVVILTMLAAHAFDSRLIWDIPHKKEKSDR